MREEKIRFQTKQSTWQAQDQAWQLRQTAQEAMNRAHGRQQTAYQSQDQAWQRRQAARDVMDRTYSTKQAAYETQQEAWGHLQSIRNENGPRIDYLNGQQETAYQNMRDAFDNASSAHDSGDGASARSYADDGHSYKAESQGYVEERRSLVVEIREAKEAWEETRTPFQSAKSEFEDARGLFKVAKSDHEARQREFQAAKTEFERERTEFNRAKANHEQKQREFREAKGAFDRAKAASLARLEFVRGERERQRSDKRALAEQAGVPSEYLDDIWVSTQSDGSVNIYFGGQGAPNGPGHGHYAMDAQGNVTYARDPYEEHGGQNFTDSQRDYDDVVGVEAASGGEFGFRCRFRGFDAFVESNTNRRGEEKIDIYYGPNGPFAPGHHHAVALRDDPYNFVFDDFR